MQQHAVMANFVGLPEELITNISLRLAADDVSAFRLTCSALQQKSFHEFAREYFSSKAFILTTDSLKVLVGIASSPRLRGYLRKVIITTAYFSIRALQCPNGCRCAWQPTVKQREAYATYIKDQEDLVATGRDEKMLTEAFALLPALAHLSIADCISFVPLGVDYRGRHKVVRTTGRPPSHAPDQRDTVYQKWLHHVWHVFCKSLCNSHIVTLQSFETSTAKSANGLSTDDLKFDAPTLASLTKAFKGVKKIQLKFRGNVNTANRDWEWEAATPNDILSMRNFASTFRAPEFVDITLDYSPTSGTLFQAIGDRLDVRHITTFFLENVAVSTDILGPSISRLTAVKDLQLSFIDLTSGTWVPILKLIQKFASRLEHLHLIYLLEAGQKV